MTLSVVIVGSTFLMLSVGVSIYRRRYAVPTGDLISAPATRADVMGCFEELQDVSIALQKHLERWHHLLGSYDADEVEQWASGGAVWRGQWNVLGQRCRFSPAGREASSSKEMEAMATAHDELGKIFTTYTQELKRFGKDLAPRLGRIQERLSQIGERIGAAGSAGDSQ